MSNFPRDKPRLSDRLRGKTSEELMDEIKKEFSNDKNWFDRRNNPTFDSSFPRGFPFSDDDNDRDRDCMFGRSGNVRSHLDDLAKRHPEFADKLRFPAWSREQGTSSNLGETWEKAFKVPCNVEEQAEVNSRGNSRTDPNYSNEHNEPRSSHSPAQRSNLDQHGLRNTVDIGEQAHKTVKQDTNNPKRAFSAPPSGTDSSDSQNDQKPKRFTSKIEITPVNPFEHNRDGNQSKDDISNKNEPSEQSTRTNSNQPKVRHIPIFVEGRNDPIIPKEDSSSNMGQTSSSRGVPPVQVPLKRNVENFSTPPHVKENQFGQQQKQQQQQQKEHTPPKSQPSTPKKCTPLEQIQGIQRDVNELGKKVEAFNGKDRMDKEYLFLDEMLTRNLIKLDVIETDGNEEIRATRKNTIKSIQKCISLLESKVPSPSAENATEDFKMTSQEEAESIPLESNCSVKSSNDGDSKNWSIESKNNESDANTSSTPMEVDSKTNSSQDNSKKSNKDTSKNSKDSKKKSKDSKNNDESKSKATKL